MDSLNEALIACVRAAGGSAVVGEKMFPEKSREAAQRLLLDCLNEDRPAKLSPDQVVLILRLARQRGFHEGINFLLETLSYNPTLPISVRDETSELMRQVVDGQRLVIESQVRLEGLMDRLNSMTPKLRAAA